MSLRKIILSALTIWATSVFAETSHPEAHSEGHAEIHAEGKTEINPDLRVYQMEDSGPDVKIPSQLWSMIHEIKPEKNLIFAPIKIRLQEKTKGVLVSPVLAIEMPRGGGEVDLSQFVRGVQGTFLVFFDYDEIRETKEEQIFFVSRAKKRRIEKEIWGAGCNKFMDITKFMNDKVLKEGLEVNTTRQRHLSLLGGTFVFSAKNQIAQVTFKDSTATSLFCEDPKLPGSGKSNEGGE